jgi:hypothetical protein
MSEVTPKRTFRFGSIVVLDDGRNLELHKSNTPSDRIVIEHADRWDVLSALMAAQDQVPFDKRCADALADEVDVLVRRKAIDSRSPAADALLSYRDPSTPRSDRLVELEKRNEELRAAMVRITNETPYPDEVKGAIEQRGALVAEIGTLRNRNHQLSIAYDELAAACGKKNTEINALRAELEERTASNLRIRGEKDVAYTERNRLVAALAWAAMDRPGPFWFAGVGRHQPDPDPAWDPEWLTVVFVDTPKGQLSWHVHDSDRPLFEGLPTYHGQWDGHTTAEKYERLGRLFR